MVMRTCSVGSMGFDSVMVDMQVRFLALEYDFENILWHGSPWTRAIDFRMVHCL